MTTRIGQFFKYYEIFFLSVAWPIFISFIAIIGALWYSDYRDGQCKLLTCKNELTPEYISGKCLCVEIPK